MNFLEQTAKKRAEDAISRRKQILEMPIEKRKKRRSIIEAMRGQNINIIAEIKRASPSRGLIKDVRADEVAREYEVGGASAISVLTEPEHFKGSIEDLMSVRQSVKVPVLRKDFIADPLQLHESQAIGADAILLIVSVLKERTREFVEIAHTLGLECLVEIHSEDEIGHALDSKAQMIGVNNRDLKNMEIDLGNFERIAPLLPPNRVLIAESGVTDKVDVQRMVAAGADGVLIGSSLMSSSDMRKMIGELLS